MPEISLQTDVQGARWDRLSAAQMARLDGAVRLAALGIERTAKLLILTGPKTGRIVRGKRGKPHRRSAPGEAPASDTGTLVNSIKAKRYANLEWWVTVGAEYGYGLEFGRARVLPRPFMRPAARAVRPVFLAACREAMRGKP